VGLSIALSSSSARFRSASAWIRSRSYWVIQRSAISWMGAAFRKWSFSRRLDLTILGD
jgi:hypothetical protein